MKALTVVCLAALLAACTTTDTSLPGPAALAVHFGDLDVATARGRTDLVARVRQSATAFCRMYDPQDDDAIRDQGLLNRPACPAVATDILVREMPTQIRRAYHAGLSEQSILARPSGD